MGNMQNVFSTLTEWAVTFAVPGTVWALLVAGMFQLVRGKRQVPAVQRSSQKHARKTAG
jgi:hypothetical protein